MAAARRDIQDRAFAFACAVVSFCRRATGDEWTRQLTRQLVRAATGVGANLEEAVAGQTRADFIAKVFISLKEVREAHYWIRLIAQCDPHLRPSLAPLMSECNELVAILTAIARNARSRSSGG